MRGGIFILSGAGLSAESGLKTFRAEDGLWEDHRVEDVATPEAFVRDPAWCSGSTTRAAPVWRRRTPTRRTSPWRIYRQHMTRLCIW